jgi:hypothetical protein
MFGWAIRHLLRVKDNYFGAFTNFSTLEEYNRKKDKQVVGDLVSEKYRPGCVSVSPSPRLLRALLTTQSAR